MRTRIIRFALLASLLASFLLVGLAAPTHRASAAINCYATIWNIQWYTTGELYQDGGWNCYDAGYPRNSEQDIYYQQGGKGGPWVFCTSCVGGSGPYNYSVFTARNFFPVGYCTNFEGRTQFWDENGRYYSIWSPVQYKCQ